MTDKIITITLAIFILAGLIIIPIPALAGVSYGLNLCFKILIPSLFPFFICSKLLVKSGFAKTVGRWCRVIMRPLFNVPGCGSVAFIMGSLSGYPVGAKCAVDLYEQNLCTKTEAERLICSCNNCGPLFILGSVATAMLLCPKAGFLLYISHVLSAITVGILMRFYKYNEKVSINSPRDNIKTSEPVKSFGEILSTSISESVELMLYVCGFVIFFNMLLALLEHTGIIRVLSSIFMLFGIPYDIASALTYGFFEIVSGTSKICALNLGNLKLVLISIIITWSGVSVILQITGIISKHRLNKKVFILSKAIQAIISGFYTLLLLKIPMGDIAVFASPVIVNVFNAWLYTFLYLIIALISILLLSVISFIYKIVARK